MLIFRKYDISHLIVRLIVIVNLSHLAYEVLNPTYYRTLRKAGISDVISAWYVASSLLLPLFVIFKALWPGKAESESDISRQKRKRAIFIDAAFALSWFLTLWLGLLYVLTTRAIL